MTLFLVPRTSAWRTEEELDAAVDCLPSIAATMADDVRWVTSYVVREADGTLGAYCLYEATSIEAIARHAEASRLPVDAVKPVERTLVPDPV